MSNGLSISGTHTGGGIYKLNDPVQLENVRKAIEKDGRDQVVVKAGESIYVIEGDSLNLGGLFRGQAGKTPELSLELDGQTLPATLIQFDDEVSSGWDGAKQAGKALGFAYCGLMVAELVSKVAFNKVLLPVSPRNSAFLLGGMALTMAGGAVYGATRHPQAASKVPALGTRIN